MLSEAFSAQEACAMGLVNKVLPTSSLRATKCLMKGKELAAIKAKMEEEGQLFSEMLVSKEAKEAFTAFFEKGKPDFTKFK
jgi:enoyl-CoA hydratase/carnithine racemase